MVPPGRPGSFPDGALLLSTKKRCDHLEQRLRPLAQFQSYTLIGNNCVKIAVGHAVIARPVGGKGEDLPRGAAPRALLIVEGAKPADEFGRCQLVDQDIASPDSRQVANGLLVLLVVGQSVVEGNRLIRLALARKRRCPTQIAEPGIAPVID